MNTENGFKAMSQNADKDDPNQKDAGDSSIEKGFDEDSHLSEASDRPAEIQRLLMDEIRDRPLRALGWAATAGFVLGIWVSR